MGAHDGVEVGVSGEAQGAGAGGFYGARPAFNDALDGRVRLPANQIDRLIAGHALQRRDHVGHGGGYSRQRNDPLAAQCLR